MDQSPPEAHDDGTGASQSAKWESQDAPDAPTQASPGDEDGSEQASKPMVPMQKRRRVTRACDECRRKKIKCDGKQPCTHCTVYSYECTYDQPSNRRRNAAPQYVEALEHRCRRYEALLRAILPNVDLNDPRIEPALRQNLMEQMHPASGDSSRNDPAAQPIPSKPMNSMDAVADAQLESMVKATGQLDLDEQGNWDYHGHSSGLSFMRRLREQFGDIMGPVGGTTPFFKSRPMSQVFDSPHSSKSNVGSPTDSSTLMGLDLPPKSVALELANNAINDATILLRFVHWPSFIKNFNRIYDTAPEEYGNEENSFLPLLYTVLAVGSLFAKDRKEADLPGYGAAIDEGFKYFKAARRMMDIADCRDLPSLQAIAFMIIFLQCSAKLSTCYSYIGVALRSALRMGMHRSFNDSFNPIEAEMRKRLFWVLRKMDIYVGALLGLPHTFSDDEIDQDYPTGVDDEYITENEILPMPEGKVSVIAASNAHTDLLKILSKIVRYIYPIKGHPATQGRYSVSYAKIREIEKDLNVWIEALPMGLKPGGEAPTVIVRVQQLLRMAYAHAQMTLYRPFVHYVSNCKSQQIDKRAYACASACVSVSRNIVHICVEMKKRRLLVGAYWFSMYTTFFAILTLVYFALENPENPTTQDVLRDAVEGKDCLAQLAKRSMAADRCTATLTPLFDQLPERIKRGREMAAASRKRRHAPSPSLNPNVPDNVPATSAPEVGLPQPSMKRANTLPEGFPTGDDRGSAFAYTAPTSHPHLSVQSTYSGTPNQGFLDASSLPPSTAVSTSMPNIPFNAPQQHFSPLTSAADFDNNGGSFYSPIPDLSAIMFPSADPFAYPNPPMTTFENSGFNNLNMDLPGNSGTGAGISQSSGMPDQLYNFPPTSHPGSNRNSGIFSVPQAPTSNADSSMPSGSGGFGTPDPDAGGELDVQLFGPMPMYMMQGERPEAQSNQFQPQRNLQGGGGWDSNPLKIQQGNQLGTGGDGMNLDQLLMGQEWSGMFSNPDFWHTEQMGRRE